MLGVPSIALGFFLGNCLDMVSVLVLEFSVILGFFLGGHCARKQYSYSPDAVLKGSEDDGEVEYNIFDGN